MIAKLKRLFKFLQKVINDFMSNDPMIYSASIAFYTIFSLPAMIVLIISITGFFFGEEAISGELYYQIKGLVGPESASEIQGIVKNASIADKGIVSTLISIVTLIFSSTTVFITLQGALNRIWGVKTISNAGFFKLLIDRVLSFAMVVTLGFLLAVSLLLEALIAILNRYIGEMLSEFSQVIIVAVEQVISIAIIASIFALIFKSLPDARIKWKDVFGGALITSILFVLGKFLIGLYIGNGSFDTSYGAAGAFVIVLVWVYYSSVIVLFGAECTQVIVNLRGRKIRPSKYAVNYKTVEVEKTD